MIFVFVHLFVRYTEKAFSCTTIVLHSHLENPKEMGNLHLRNWGGWIFCLFVYLAGSINNETVCYNACSKVMEY